MGQSQGSHSNPLLSDWQQHPTQHNLYTNIKSKEQAESHLTVLNKNQQAVLRKRMQQHHNFISKILYYEPVQKNKIIKDQAKYYVYTEKLFAISADMWVPTTSALSILKGFRRLSSNYGLMRINHQLIKVNNKKQIKVWINEDVISNQVWKQAQSQEQMLADIVKTIMLFDPPTGGLMVKCFSINEAINNILHNMTENNKTQLNFSNRTNKNQQKARSSYNSNKEGPITNKYNFRSTKETEDDIVKPINQNTIKYNTKKQIPKSVQVQPQNINYLHNVPTLKSPTYINVDETQPKPNNYNALKGYGQDANIRDYNYSQQNNIQKQSSIQFNSSHPIKTTPSATLGRPYKPIQYKNNQNYPQSFHNINTINSHVLTPSVQRTFKDSQKFSQANSRTFLQSNYQFDRKSNINKNYLERMEMSQDSDVAVQDKTKGSVQYNDRSQANTSRQFMQTHSFTKNRNGTTEDPANNTYIDSNRTKTQQFYSSNNNDHFVGYSPRLRTHYLQSTSQMQNIPHGNQMTKQIVPQNGVSVAKNLTPTISQRRPQVSTQKIKNEAQQDQCQQQRRRQMKIKQAQRIKQQMSCLGIQTNTKTLTNDKSERDLLIRQRIDEKNKKHEKLKIQITRLLGGDNDS